MIPKNLYLTFRDETLPKVYQENLDRWKAFYPDWHIHYFSDAKVYAFFKEHFPHYADDLHKIRWGSTLADLFRYGVIYTFGGMYAGIDTFPEKKLPEAWLEKDVVIGYEYQPSKFECVLSHIFPNNCLCQWTFLSKPKHPLFKKMLDTSMKRLRAVNFTVSELEELMYITGPYLFTEVVEEYRQDPHLLILDMDYFASDNMIEPSERALVRHQFHGQQGWCLQTNNSGIQLFSQKQ